jgi:hypothetical protein
MTQDDIIRMAREAGIPLGIRLINSVQSESCVSVELERFAALVAADATLAIKQALAQEHALHELARLGQEIEQEPTPWRDMVVVSLVREGINKHRARELADHFAAQRPWQGMTEKDWEYVKDSKGTSLDTFDQGAAWAANQLMRRNI